MTYLTLSPVQMTFHGIGSSIQASHDQVRPPHFLCFKMEMVQIETLTAPIKKGSVFHTCCVSCLTSQKWTAMMLYGSEKRKQFRREEKHLWQPFDEWVGSAEECVLNCSKMTAVYLMVFQEEFVGENILFSVYYHTIMHSQTHTQTHEHCLFFLLPWFGLSLAQSQSLFFFFHPNFEPH